MIGIFSNGFGETVIASKIANSISDKGAKVVFFPLVGNPKVKESVEVAFFPKNEGSGGLTTQSLDNFLKDLRHGLLGDFFRYLRSIRKYNFKVIFIVGDPFLLFLVKLFSKDSPIVIFNSIYKSELVDKHYWFEKLFIKKYVDYFIPRDKITAEYFSNLGVKTIYFGNPMVDAIDVRGIDYRKYPDMKTLLLLPGSRDWAYRIIPKFLCVVESVFQKFTFFNVLCPLSRSLSLDKVKDVVIKHGWEYIVDEEKVIFRKGVLDVVCAYDAFGDMLMVSDVVLSCAGTATEQSAGYGKPTIMFYDNFGWSRGWFNRQKILLGDNLKLFDRFGVSEISDEIVMLFNDTNERKRRGEIGKKMIEGIGSIEKISDFVFKILSPQ